ncbi:hypothetical protein COCNU_07G004140 [Cocos nucifera]|uniref:Uncharacterized protein n=1 Tax=Cocos nucifera TaxID=13894 RepID=A0A8K0IF27_COCNU|nr:hypothetical protein COCNU_07G004140 [Cocos nucifera]
MDSIAPVTEVSQELARESLIAISQSLPEKSLHSNPLPTNHTDANGVGVKEGGVAEKYRSKLISISCTESSDVQPAPSALENLHS